MFGGVAMLNRLFDLMVGSILLILSTPIILFFGIIVILTSPGGLIFKQKRVGLNKKMFYIYKIRTMYINSGELPAAPKDPRITPIGRFMRKVKIDELPQFWNVIKGEMSLVGPRPIDLFNWQLFSIDNTLRLQILTVKPGMTGPRQVEKFYFDEESLYQDREDFFLWFCNLETDYVLNKCLSGDLYLCIKTFWLIAKIFFFKINFLGFCRNVPK